MKNNILIALALVGTQMILPVPASAAVSFEGMKPLVLPDCVPEGKRPYADEPEYRELSDTRPVCIVKPKPKPAPVTPKPKPYAVPQK